MFESDVISDSGKSHEEECDASGGFESDVISDSGKSVTIFCAMPL